MDGLLSLQILSLSIQGMNEHAIYEIVGSKRQR
jgi:hypothetical protein